MPKKVNYDFALEMQEARHERIIKKFIALIAFLVFALIASNGAWLYYESQFVEEKTVIEADQEADNQSRNIIIGGDYNADKAEGDGY